MGFKIKQVLAFVMVTLKLTDLFFWLQRPWWNRAYIRVINYHDLTPEESTNFESQLKYFQKVFSNVSWDDFSSFISDGIWLSTKPGLIISFDDGFRSTIEIAAPMLEKYGFTGWFFVPTALINSDIRDAESAKKLYGLQSRTKDNHKNMFLSKEELIRLSANHVVGCHTRHHVRLNANLSTDILRDEILGCREELKRLAGINSDTFAWVGGEESSYSKKAMDILRESPYRAVFSTNNRPFRYGDSPLQVERTNVEASYSLDLVKFQVCGVLDCLYWAKRRRLQRSLA